MVVWVFMEVINIKIPLHDNWMLWANISSTQTVIWAEMQAIRLCWIQISLWSLQTGNGLRENHFKIRCTLDLMSADVEFIGENCFTIWGMLVQCHLWFNSQLDFSQFSHRRHSYCESPAHSLQLLPAVHYRQFTTGVQLPTVKYKLSIVNSQVHRVKMWLQNADFHIVLSEI